MVTKTIRRARAVLLVAALLVTGCVDDEGRASGGGGDGPPSNVGGGEGPCAWAVRADEETLNVAYPDTSATYWAIAYALAEGEELELTGTFPAARYASFISYGPAGGAIDVLTDRDVEPDDEGTNPFAEDWSGARGGYTVRITRDEPGSDAGSAPNVLAARRGATAPEASGGAPAPTFAPGEVPPPTPNLLGSGEEGGDDVGGGTTLFRVYLSEDDADPSGGGLPEVTLVAEGGERTPIPTCEEPGASPRALELTESNGPPTDREAPSQPVFIRPDTGVANLFPNPDNIYLATIAFHRPGVVAVVTGVAPEVPDQVRFWSLCTDEYRKPYPVSSCVADRDVALDEGGRYTFVISTPEDRPASATEAEGVTWLDWGSTEVDNLLLMRHMLPDPDDPTSAINVEPGGLVQRSMGPHAPLGRYCTVEDFEAVGADCDPA